MIPVIDLFAGPGGLNEGFSQVKDASGNFVFETIASFEMDPIAVRTLKLRDTFRDLDRRDAVPAAYYDYIRGEISWQEFLKNADAAAAYERATGHVHEVELGAEGDDSVNLIRAALEAANGRTEKPWVLIGGPPCQAYSLAGRSRRANDSSFAEDKKHFLYREYLRIIRTFGPPVFVMENVKGLLSSTTTGESMFARIKADLEQPGNGFEYDIHSLVSDLPTEHLKPSDFIIRSERFGIPQKRHRVILVGVRKGSAAASESIGRLVESAVVTVDEALAGLAKLRSGISPASGDTAEAWDAIRASQAVAHGPEATPPVSELTRGGRSNRRTGEPANERLRDWIIDSRLLDVVQHESRSHMAEDLKRYRFAASRARATGVSPRLREFPPALQPNHRNAASELRPFEDRFRVQVGSGAATTIVSHIAKDGHYYIHPDPDQMRSLTVREAARLQTFPDNYFFEGNRTQQYHQVGNAVPPLLALQIGKIVSELLITARARAKRA